MYHKELETVPGAKQARDAQKKKEAAERLANIAKNKKKKRGSE